MSLVDLACSNKPWDPSILKSPPVKIRPPGSPGNFEPIYEPKKKGKSSPKKIDSRLPWFICLIYFPGA